MSAHGHSVRFRYTELSVPLPFPLYYSPLYDLNLGEHVFPSCKYAGIHDRLIADGVAQESDFVDPLEIADEDLWLAHTEEWITKLKTGGLSLAEAMRLEIPVSEKMLHAVWRMAAGSLRAAEDAVRTGHIGCNIGGGFHHAFAGHGEGFCAINDIAVAIRKLQHTGRIAKAMVVDCDVHHGNGVASIFANDPSVFTFSIHQQRNYPAEKPLSNLDIELEDNTGDREYNRRLSEGLELALSRFTPDLIVYVAGADPFMEDQLGGLLLTFDGLLERDRLVLDLPFPIAIVLAGGYSYRVKDTITIHCNTIRTAIQSCGSRVRK